jgi:hypothetical protein
VEYYQRLGVPFVSAAVRAEHAFSLSSSIARWIKKIRAEPNELGRSIVSSSKSKGSLPPCARPQIKQDQGAFGALRTVPAVGT